MAWLKGLAGKAEDFLNQIDHNAAAVLKEKQENGDNQLTEVTWDRERDRPRPRPELFQPSLSSIPATQLDLSTVELVSQNIGLGLPTPQSSNNSSAINSVRSSPNLSSLFVPVRPSKAKPKKDEDFIDFLNSSSPAVPEEFQPTVESREDSVNKPSSGLQLIRSSKSSPLNIELVTENLSTSSDTSVLSIKRDSSDQDLGRVDDAGLVTQITISKEADELKTENGLLKSELRSFNNEMSLLLQRAKAAEKECTNLQQQLTKLHASKTQMTLSLTDKHEQVVRLEMELQVTKQELSVAMQLAKKLEIENTRLVQDSENTSDDQNAAVVLFRQELSEKEEEFERARSVHQQELISIRGVIKSLEAERVSSTNQIVEVRQQMNECNKERIEWQEKFDKSRLDVAEVRSEFDQYRVRAQRILHDKDKLITELRGEGVGRGSPVDDVTALELEQLRQERELVREEVMQVSTRLQATSAELAEAERKLELSREHALEASTRLQNSLLEEKSLRQSAEEDCRTQTEGLRSVREELSRHRSLLASKVREREAELTKLRSQLSQRPTTSMGQELESRMHTLTQTLVQKQTSLETITTERNALRLQYEKLEHKHQEAMAHFYRNQGVNVNDTDDAKARVPSFLEESPFDTGVARRVKRAYSNLDAVSIRTGVFLRRYPLARILMLSYMVLLHLWVMIVLFTYTPETHSK